MKSAVLEMIQPGYACKRSAFNIRASHKELVNVAGAWIYELDGAGPYGS